MIISSLLTKYILAPLWVRIAFLIIICFISREIHFIVFDLSSANCMQGFSNKDLSDQEILSLIKNWQKDAQTTQRMLIGHADHMICRGITNESPTLDMRNVSALSQNNFDIITTFIEKNLTEKTDLQHQISQLETTNKVLTERDLCAQTPKSHSELLLRERIQFHESKKKGLYKIINSMHEKNHLRIKQTIAEFLEPQPLVNENSSNPIELHLNSKSKAEDLPLSLRFEKGSNPTINIINNPVVDTPKNEDKNTSWFSWCNIS